MLKHGTEPSINQYLLTVSGFISYHLFPVSCDRPNCLFLLPEFLSSSHTCMSLRWCFCLKYPWTIWPNPNHSFKLPVCSSVKISLSCTPPRRFRHCSLYTWALGGTSLHLPHHCVFFPFPHQLFQGCKVSLFLRISCNAQSIQRSVPGVSVLIFPSSFHFLLHSK